MTLVGEFDFSLCSCRSALTPLAGQGRQQETTRCVALWRKTLGGLCVLDIAPVSVVCERHQSAICPTLKVFFYLFIFFANLT